MQPEMAIIAVLGAIFGAIVAGIAVFGVLWKLEREKRVYMENMAVYGRPEVPKGVAHMPQDAESKALERLREEENRHTQAMESTLIDRVTEGLQEREGLSAKRARQEAVNLVSKVEGWR